VDPALRARKAVFRVSPTSKHPDVYFVLMVSKVLKGELDDHYDVYLKSTVRFISLDTNFGRLKVSFLTFLLLVLDFFHSIVEG
jgi:uncharacterized membrane protein